MTTTNAQARAKVSPELLRDRWEGLLWRINESEEEPEHSKLFWKLHRTLEQLFAGVARDSAHSTNPFPVGSFPDIDREGTRGDVGGFVLAETIDLIRDNLLRRIEELELAR